MIDLTAHILEAAPEFDAMFRAGVDSALNNVKPLEDYIVLANVRARHGFINRSAPLLTAPDANVKLDKASVASYGLTLYHFRSVLPAVYGTDGIDFKRIAINACPNAGHCVKVCVLNNGNGRYDSVQRAWLWRTDFLARHPYSFARVLAYELVKGVRKFGEILFRPNVNSDIAWHDVCPSLCNGYVHGVTSYGYSKRPDSLEGNGWKGTTYRVAYSWNERSNIDAVREFLARGGSVAVVTARRKGAPVTTVYPFGTTANAIDADITDEWLFVSGAVGDLSAKGKARDLIGKSKFVAPSDHAVTIDAKRRVTS